MIHRFHIFIFIMAAMFFALPHTALADVYQDISYVPESDLKGHMLDIYTPKKQTEQPSPVLIFVHGGAWNLGDKSIVTPVKAEEYTKQGIIVVSVNYRLSPRYKHPTHVKDLAKATKWIVDHIGEYGGNPKSIVLVGHSAGAHLVALLATEPLYLAKHNLPLNMFNCVAPVDTAAFDLTKLQRGKMANVIQQMQDKAFGTNEEVLAKASPMLLIKKERNYSPFFLYVTAERPAAVEETQIFAHTLNNNGAFARNAVIDKGYTHRDMGKIIFDPRSQIYKDLIGALGKNL